MRKNPKATNNYYCCGTSSDNEITLTGMADLDDVPCQFQYVASRIEGHCILDNFQTDELFFYEITQYKTAKRSPTNTDLVERGIGSISKNGRKFYLNRITPLSSQHGMITSHLEFDDNKKLFIRTYVPEDYRELFSIKNTIIATEVEGCPSPVELQDNTLLGRLNGSIQSIDHQELWSLILANTKKPTEGMIRYNKRDKCFEGYDGKKWRALMWGEK